MPKRQPSKDPRRQHWVPCFYLRHLATPESRANGDPLVWVFSKEAGDPFPTSERQIAAKSFLYSPKDKAGNRQFEMESKLADLEGTMNTVWPILADDFVDFHADQSIRRALALFVSILHLQHPKQLISVEQLHAQIVTGLDALPKDEAGRPLIESIEHRGHVRPFDVSNWHEYKTAGPEQKKQMFVDGIRQNATHGAEILMKKRWSVIFGEQPVFITTDTPVTIVNSHRDVFGIGTPGTEIYFPLSPTRVLRIDDGNDEDGLYYPLLDDKYGSGLLNMSAWHHAERFMFSSRHTDEVCAEMLAWAESDPSRRSARAADHAQ